MLHSFYGFLGGNDVVDVLPHCTVPSMVHRGNAETAADAKITAGLFIAAASVHDVIRSTGHPAVVNSRGKALDHLPVIANAASIAFERDRSRVLNDRKHRFDVVQLPRANGLNELLQGAVPRRRRPVGILVLLPIATNSRQQYEAQ